MNIFDFIFGVGNGLKGIVDGRVFSYGNQ